MEKKRKQQEDTHALLSASSAHRWLHCTPSARREEAYPDSSSFWAREGSLAHAIAAHRLKTLTGRDASAEVEEIAYLKNVCDLPPAQMTEMHGFTESYASLVLEKFDTARDECAAARLLIETRLDFSDWVPDGFGTGDAVIIANDFVEVVDFKYGRGVRVDAERNPQMMLYALGAMAAYDYGYDFKVVRMTIVQPRREHISEWTLPVCDLLKWADEELRPLALLANAGKGALCAGDWCRFCRAHNDCKAYDDSRKADDPALDFNGVV